MALLHSGIRVCCTPPAIGRRPPQFHGTALPCCSRNSPICSFSGVNLSFFLIKPIRCFCNWKWWASFGVPNPSFTAGRFSPRFAHSWVFECTYSHLFFFSFWIESGENVLLSWREYVRLGFFLLAMSGCWWCGVGREWSLIQEPEWRRRLGNARVELGKV